MPINTNLVLVVGAAGRAAGEVVPALVARGAEVRGLVRYDTLASTGCPSCALKSVPRQDRFSSTTGAFRLHDPQLTPVCAVDPG